MIPSSAYAVNPVRRSVNPICTDYDSYQCEAGHKQTIVGFLNREHLFCIIYHSECHLRFLFDFFKMLPITAFPRSGGEIECVREYNPG